MQSDLKETVISLIVKQLHPRGRSDVVELDTDLLTLGIDSLGMLVFWIAAEKELGLDLNQMGPLLRKVRSVKEVISVCEQLVSARMDNR
jgi:acyl carrier protein